jgi:hypothetical protein
MNLTPKQQKRVVTELSVLEGRLDMVLFENEWIETHHKGQKIKFKNSAETHKIMQEGGGTEETLDRLKKAGLCVEMSTRNLNQIMLARSSDDDDDDGFPYVKTGLAGAGVAGIGYGGYSAYRRGASINAAPMGGTRVGPGIGYGMTEIPNPIGPSAPSGVLKNIGTGAKAVGTDIAESPMIRNLRAFLKGGAKKVAKAI